MPAAQRKARRWSEKRWVRLTAIAGAIAAAAAVWTAAGLPGIGSSKASVDVHQGPSAVNTGSNSGNICSGDANCTVVQRADSDPRAQIVTLTGAWSEQGFIDAIETPTGTNIVALYLRSGMSATTLHSDASAILYGFQNNLGIDPIALLKTFQAEGYKLDDVLTDGRLLQSLAPGDLPLPFQTNFTPKDYTGGFQGGVFTGPLMLWIVEKAVWLGPTSQDSQVLSYLIAHGADCSVTLSFLDFNRSTLASTAPFKDLYPTIKACAH